jgi:hypothetical protein
MFVVIVMLFDLEDAFDLDQELFLPEEQDNDE